VYQYFTIYRWYFVLKFENFHEYLIQIHGIFNKRIGPYFLINFSIVFNESVQNIILIFAIQIKIDIAKDYIGEIVYVGWPHLYQAKVISVSDDDARFVDSKGYYQPLNTVVPPFIRQT
jgi:putative transposon-encoded protein